MSTTITPNLNPSVEEGSENLPPNPKDLVDPKAPCTAGPPSQLKDFKGETKERQDKEDCASPSQSKEPKGEPKGSDEENCELYLDFWEQPPDTPITRTEKDRKLVESAESTMELFSKSLNIGFAAILEDAIEGLATTDDVDEVKTKLDILIGRRLETSPHYQAMVEESKEKRIECEKLKNKLLLMNKQIKDSNNKNDALGKRYKQTREKVVTLSCRCNLFLNPGTAACC